MTFPRVLLPVILTLALGLAAEARAGSAYEVDSSHSSVVFRVKHMNAAYFYGQFTRIEGSFVFDEAKPAASSLSLEIPTASVFTADKKRDQHLKGPDFFDAKQFPKITFVSTKVAKAKAKAKGDTYEVTGKLTFRGVTKTVTIDLEKTGEAEDAWGGHRIGFEGIFTLSRSAYGVKYGADALGDEVRVIVAIEGVRKK